MNFGSGGQTCYGKPTGCTNCQFLKDNSQSSDPAFNIIVYDAYTIPMIATHSVSPNTWNKIKIKIGDGVDHIYDSGLFLEKGSFFNGIYTGFQEQHNHGRLKVSGYPNPASHRYNIKVDYLHDSEIKITFLNTLGKVVLAKSLHHISGYCNYSLDLSGVSPDLYIVKIETEKGMSEQFKLIVY